ncbi:DsrH/TusB family sulfur relay protein [Methylobacillus caricis]|uniref:DsrH/TusB family sulfur relay protein n=1 Tax=Methylobacillus caricis TaxID=1971611 RepID=UPI001CFFE484|nr:DsrH/TusB family sulfur relay protein [Methylobacillus caricis]MCB5186642.1 DsrH/TusB family sulfur relay protein [Methylobacillus caricis]
MKILQIVEQAFRTLVEEQDDTILWLTQSMAGAGADAEVLLSGNAVYYATMKQRQPAVRISDWIQQEPADIPQDINRLLNQGIPIYVLNDELAERGLDESMLHDGIKAIDKQQLVSLYNRMDQIWQW